MGINENFYPIPKYEGLYAITQDGRVWSKCGKGKWLKLQKDTSGYLSIQLSKNNATKAFSVHRLVAQTFIPNPKNKPEVNHKDCNPSNNNFNNLEWCTQKENIQYASRMGRMIRSKATKGKMSKAHKGKILSEETKRKLSEANKGKSKSEEHKRKISETLKRRNNLIKE